MWKIDKGSKTGVTTDAYTDAMEWHCSELREKTILLKNSHAGFTLVYKLTGYACHEGIDKELVSERTLAPGETAEFHYDRQWDSLILGVKDGTGHADYRIDYQGQGA